ncbi:MAG: AI-2E family transporter [Jiangellaceae bacterium]
MTSEPGGIRLPPLSHYAKATAVVLAVLALAALAWATRGVLLLVIIGFLLATGLDPVVRGLERQVGRRGPAVLITSLVVLTGIVLFVIIAIRPAITEAADFISSLPEILDQLAQRFAGTSFAEFLARPDVEEAIRGALDDIASFAAESVEVVAGVLAGVLGAVFTGFTVAAITVYFMLALPRLKAFAGKAAGDEQRVAVVAESMIRIGGYVTGQLGICACAGIASGIFFVIIDMPYAALLAIIVAVLDAVPQVGATLGAIIAIAVALTVSLGTAVAVLIFFVLYQQVENYLVAPRVFASAVSLTPITVFLAVLFGGAVGGFVGAIIALPVAATLKVIFRYVYRTELAASEGRVVPEALAPPPPRPPRKLRRKSNAEASGEGAAEQPK